MIKEGFENREIEELVTDISEKLQKLENLIKLNNIKRVDIKFPRGYIRKADYFKSKLSFIHDDITLSNISYCLQLSDVIRWILNRFDIDFSARSMLIKYGIILIASSVEAILYRWIEEQGKKPNKRFSKNIKKTEMMGLNSDLCLNIGKLREQRNDIHLHRVETKEYDKYTLKDYNEAVETLNILFLELNKQANRR